MTDITSDGIQLPSFDLSTKSPDSDDHGRVFYHNGNGEIDLTSGITTSRAGMYVWNFGMGAWGTFPDSEVEFSDHAPEDFLFSSALASPDGVASLDSNGELPDSQIPSVAISNTDVVADQAERLALPAETGDVAIQNDENQSYILKGTDPSLDSEWKILKSPTDAVSSVFGRTGAITTETGDYTHAQIGNVSTDDHHTRYSNQEARNAVSGASLSGGLSLGGALDVGGNVNFTAESDLIFNAGNKIRDSGSTLSITTDGSGTGEVRLYDLNSSSTVLSAKEGGLVDTPTGQLSEMGNRVATRTWTNSNADVPNADYADSAGDADTLDGEHAGAFANASHGHSQLHNKYTDGEARGAIETGGVNQVIFNNIEDVGIYQLGIDASEGFLGNWGNGTAVLWDSHNVSTDGNLYVSGGTGAASQPTIGMDNNISVNKVNIGRDGLQATENWMEIDGGSSGILLEYYNEREVRIGNNTAEVSINGYGPVVSAQKGNEGYEIQKNGSDTNGVINFKT